MDNYKLAFIHGKNEDVRNVKIGDIEYVGDEPDDLHSNCLLEYARKNHSDIEIFKQLNIRYKPEVIGFLFVHMFNDIIFFNTTKDVNKYGHTGMFLLPNDISVEQRKSLFDLASSIANYEISIFSSLRLEEGILVGDELFPLGGEKAMELLEKYFEKQEGKTSNVHK